MGQTPACIQGQLRIMSAPASHRTLSPAQILPGSFWPKRMPAGSSANVLGTDLFAQVCCVVCESKSWAARRWEWPSSPLCCSHLTFPTPCITLTTTSVWQEPETCSITQSSAMSCPKEHLDNALLQTLRRLEISFCCKFTPTPSQVIMDDDLLLISNSGYDHLLAGRKGYSAKISEIPF